MAKIDPNQPITRKILDEAVEAILNGVDRLVNGLRAEVKSGFAKVDERFVSLDAKIDQTKYELTDEIDGLKADLSDTPRRKEFEVLKRRVNKHYPIPD